MREKIALTRLQRLRNTDPIFYDHIIEAICEGIEKGLLTEEERDNCTPTNDQLEKYLAEPDDEIAAEIRAFYPTTFRIIGRCLLYGRNIAQAQVKKSLSLLKEK